ncbi:hypothetical protein GLV98_01225 [Halobacillus litoralis]|uniref:DUF3953 domain-containing protein n=1 Tax=Halobacillus litoralis TaxID=45668 RepID=A0A845DYH8_9BACI|nr:hypothetical protein [Halobacillus litoralis]MYL48080.1 hypothetical protein [Halobacillus litoralis]
MEWRSETGLRLRILTIIRFIIGLLVISLSGYGLWTEDFRILPFMLLMIGFLMFVTGMIEIENRRGAYSILHFLTATGVFVFLFCTYII